MRKMTKQESDWLDKGGFLEEVTSGKTVHFGGLRCGKSLARQVFVDMKPDK